jgi:hypothetical protein
MGCSNLARLPAPIDIADECLSVEDAAVGCCWRPTNLISPKHCGPVKELTGDALREASSIGRSPDKQKACLVDRSRAGSPCQPRTRVERCDIALLDRVFSFSAVRHLTA